MSCKSQVIAWSHGARYRTGLQLIGESVENLLDYGCGDGTFLALASPKIGRGLGVDVATDEIEDCRTRLAGHTNLQFCRVAELDRQRHDGIYDVVTCMETLEHCTTPVVESVLTDLRRMVKPDGLVIISVPIETGVPFLLKRTIRSLAAMRGLSDYRHYEPYSLRDAARMLVAGPDTTLDRPVYGGPEFPCHSHYGFNWKNMRKRIQHYLAIEQTHFSPLGSLGGIVSSQAWFICRRPG